MKILVTGGAGFIGSHLCERLLADGHAVVSLDNFNDFYDPAVKERNIEEIRLHSSAARFKSVKGDIRNIESVNSLLQSEKPDLVVHLAAMAGVRPSIENPVLYEDVNIRGTSILLEACRKNSVLNFVFASSSSVYGNNPKVPFSESDPVDHPISPYAATKKAGELICHTYHYLFQMNIACLRFFTVYGPRQRPDLAIHKFTRVILEDKALPFYGSGSTQRDYTYIDDIIDGVVKAVRWASDRSGPAKFDIFNLGESRVISLSELVDALQTVLGKTARLQKLPPQPGDVECTYADISKAKEILRYSPSTDFLSGLRTFCDWYQSRFKTVV